MNSEVKQFLEFALEAAWQAGRVTLGHFQTGIAVERKGDNSPVTMADRAAEQKLRELIGRYWPEHGIVGEEFGTVESSSRYRWVLDPIDGTKSFVSGVPLYSTLLALLDGETAVLGIIHQPALNDMIYAVQGEGCYWNGRRAHVSTTANLANAVLLSSDLNTFGKYGKADAWPKLVEATYIQRTWGDAYGYGLIATGRADVMVDPQMALWDIAPLQVILEEAGGTLTDWNGIPTIHHNESIATNKILLPQVLQTI